MAQLDIQAVRPGKILADERAAARHLDWPLLLAALVLCGVGMAAIYSSTSVSLTAAQEDPALYLKRQALAFGIGAVAMIVAAAVDYRWFRLWAPVAYLGSVALLIAVRSPLGTTVKGSQRWFQFGSFQFSPSLFTRLSLVVLLAAYLAGIKGDMTLRHVLRATTLTLVPLVLVFIQPDIGTSIILAFILAALLVVSGAKVKHLVVLAVMSAAAIFGAFQMNIIRDYQLDRLGVFLGRNTSAEATYNLEQSQIAIGAGGVFGRGFGKGTQTTLDFVPEQHTDFIFTVVGEETGFVGSVGVLLLYALLLWRILRVAGQAKDTFGTFLCVGVAAFIAIQILVNVGMTVGVMPITGIPLPFISYGGSALIADLIGIGLVQNVYLRRFA